MHVRQAPDTVVAFDEGPKCRDLMMSAKLDETMKDIAAAVQALRENGTVEVIKFCWGGGLAIHAAQVLEVDAAVAFYGSRLPQYLGTPLLAQVLGHFGRSDDHIPPHMLAEAVAALPDMAVHLSSAGHACANDARSSYVSETAIPAHERTAAVLKQHLAD